MQASRAKYRRTEEEEEVANAENVESDDSDQGEEPEATDGFVDQFEAALAARGNNIWANGGPQKDVAIRVLIQCFGSMIESHAKPDAIPDFRGRIRSEDMNHRKLLDASKHVVKARQVLIKNENFDSRDFTIFIAQKHWVKNIIRPLLELCAREDSALAMNCCSLALILIKKISDRTTKLIDKFYKKKKKAKAVSNEENKEQQEENGASSNKAVTLHDSQSEDEVSPSKIQNAKDQVLALLSFKEALCSEFCNQAITNAFRECWVREQQMTNEESKLGVARCISYFRRILSILPHKDWSSQSEILEQRIIQNRYIVQLRVFLSLLPGIISDVRRSYHDDWLTDIVLILFYIFDNFKAQELFVVWKSDALMSNFLLLAQEADAALAASAPTTAASAAASEEVLIQQAISKPVMAPEALKRRIVQQTLGAQAGIGSLSAKLLGEKVQRERQAVSNGSARFPRFTSTYQIPLHHAAGSTANAIPPPSSSATSATASSNNNNTSSSIKPTANSNAQQQQQQQSTEKPVDSLLLEGTQVIPSSSILLKDPFASHSIQHGDNLPQAREKRNKKNLTFGLENDFLETSKMQAKLTEDGQRACVVAASLAEALTADVCFKSFVRRINEDLRRDELRISPDMEWQYFSIVTKLMSFNRLKLEEEYKQVQMRRQEASLNAAMLTISGEDADESLRWEPNLINVIDSLDKMSFTRVTFAMESLLRKPETYHLAHFPMEVYTEMLAYLRIMLESSNEGHHEIAIGALYRLFYTSTGQTDPLPRLLATWKPSVFPKAHLFALVEVVHQTLKTLEAAKQLFINQGIFSEEVWKQKRKQMKKTGKKEMDMELYLLSCLRFSIDEYYKKLVSNHTVSMYMRLLQRVEHNDAVVNHRIYVFLQRMCNFQLHDDSQPVPREASSSSAMLDSQDFLSNRGGASSQSEGVSSSQISSPHSHHSHLGYMLFNVPCLQTFHHVLSNDSIVRMDSLQPLIRLIRQIVRDFGLLAKQNQLLLVEALFLHPHAHDHCVQLHNIYEAAPTAHRLMQQHEQQQFIALSDDDEEEDGDDGYEADDRVVSSRKRPVTESNNTKNNATMGSGLSDTETESDADKATKKTAHKDDDDDDDDDDDEELNDELMAQRRAAAAALSSSRRRPRRNKASTDTTNNSNNKGTKKRLIRANNKAASSSSDDEDEAVDSDLEIGSVDSADTRTKLKRLQQQETRRTRKPWSKPEDKVLKQLYRRFHGMSSIYVAISLAEELRALGSERNEQQIKHRIAHLRLLELAPEDIRSDSDNGDNSDSNRSSKSSKSSSSSISDADSDDSRRKRSSKSRTKRQHTNKNAKKTKTMKKAQMPITPDSPSVDAAQQQHQEGVTSVEKDDEHDHDHDLVEGQSWSAMGSGRNKRPFDDYDFDDSLPQQQQQQTENANKRRKKLVKNKRRLEDDDASDSDDNSLRATTAAAASMGEFTDTAPQVVYESQQQHQQQQRKAKRSRLLDDDDEDDDDDDLLLFRAPTDASAAVPETAAGNNSDLDDDQQQTKTTKTKQSLKRLLDSDDEDEDSNSNSNRVVSVGQ